MAPWAPTVPSLSPSAFPLPCACGSQGRAEAQHRDDQRTRSSYLFSPDYLALSTLLYQVSFTPVPYHDSTAS